jgi:OOP family OmpA-OmpF porin
MLCNDLFRLRLSRLVFLTVAMAAPAFAFSPPPPLIYFEYNSSELGPYQRDVLGELVAFYGKNGIDCFEAITISGHTDSAEPDAKALSQRRGEVVAETLEGYGIDRAIMTILTLGATAPLVDIGPGVKEPQNRRAVIEFVGSDCGWYPYPSP